MTSGSRAALRPIRFEPPTLLGNSVRTATVVHHLDQRAEELAAARTEAWAEGLRAARDETERVIAAHDAARVELERAAASLTLAAEHLTSRDATFTDELQDAAVRLAVGIAEEIIGRELRSCDDAVADAIVRAAQLVPDRASVVLRVHPDDLELAGPAAERAGLGTRADVVADSLVEAGGCIAVVGPLRIDSQIGPALERVRAALRV